MLVLSVNCFTSVNSLSIVVGLSVVGYLNELLNDFYVKKSLLTVFNFFLHSYSSPTISGNEITLKTYFKSSLLLVVHLLVSKKKKHSVNKIKSCLSHLYKIMYLNKKFESLNHILVVLCRK